MADQSFDAIVIGSEVSGGWAAKELTERGLKVLMLERGRNMEHVKDYVTASLNPWDTRYRGRRPTQAVAEKAEIKEELGANAFSKGMGWVHTQAQALFTKDDELLLNEIGGTILSPIPGSPGAKSANIGAFMMLMVTDCYEDANQKIFVNGLKKISEEFKTAHSKNSMHADHKTRLAFLQKLYDDQKKMNPAANVGANRRGQQGNNQSPVHYFLMMKQLTLLGFFTSEVGATKALRYIETPGAYRGCIPYKKGDKAWAT